MSRLHLLENFLDKLNIESNVKNGILEGIGHIMENSDFADKQDELNDLDESMILANRIVSSDPARAFSLYAEAVQNKDTASNTKTHSQNSMRYIISQAKKGKFMESVSENRNNALFEYIAKNTSDLDSILNKLQSNARNYPNRIKQSFDILTKNLNPTEKNYITTSLSKQVENDPRIKMSGEEVVASILGEDKTPVNEANPSDVVVAKKDTKKSKLTPIISKANMMVSRDPQKAYDLYSRGYNDPSADSYNKKYAKAAMKYMLNSDKFDINTETEKNKIDDNSIVAISDAEKKYKKLKDQVANVYIYKSELLEKLKEVKKGRGGLTGRNLDYDKYKKIKNQIKHVDDLLEKQNKKIEIAKRELNSSQDNNSKSA